MIFKDFADAYHWPPETVMRLTVRQIKAFSTKREELKDAGYIPSRTTRFGKKWWSKIMDRIVKNLLSGRRWDAKE